MPVGFLTAEDVAAARLAVNLHASLVRNACIACPVCGKHALNYDVDRMGRQWVSCLTPGCVSWVDDPNPDGNPNETLADKPVEPRFRSRAVSRKNKPRDN